MSNQQRFSGEWKIKRLGEIASIRNQKVMPEDVNPNTLCVELEHIGSGNGQLLENSSAEYSTASKYRFFTGDVLFGRLRSYLRKYWLADRDGICTTEIWPLMVDSKQVDSAFLHAIVQTDEFFAMANLSYGTHMPRTDWTVMCNFTVMLPSMQEQRAIAEVLSDVDGLINALDALIAKKRAIKQATMQQLLTGDTRLPGFSGEWEMKKMGQIGSIYGGLSGKTKTDFEGGNALYVTFLGVLENVILDMRHTERVHVRQGESQNSVMEGDLLFNASSETPGDLAIGAVMGEQLENLYLNSFCFGFRIHDKNKYIPLFFAYYFRGSVGRAIMNALAQGATRYNMSKSQFRDLELSIPSGAEQRAITAVLSDMDAEIAALEQRRDKTIAIKQGMMQQLLTGKVRLVKPER
ncbi:restriction endonuclease subunit S [Candidatus Poribacteria bacterium]|nr:MAG: restriction endonuclease subunit S [Candidatus Poribacteria bacterium]